jgi:hypothetical protein
MFFVAIFHNICLALALGSISNLYSLGRCLIVLGSIRPGLLPTVRFAIKINIESSNAFSNK